MNPVSPMGHPEVDDKNAQHDGGSAAAVALTLFVDGQPLRVDGPLSVATLLDQLGHAPRAVAVAVNETFVPRAEHPVRLLASGDRVACFRPIVGG